MSEPTLTPQQVSDTLIRVLNRLHQADPEFLAKLIDTRLACNEKVLADPTVQVMVRGDKRLCGFLGIVNGTLDELKAPRVCQMVDENDHSLGYGQYTPTP